ncbi:MAG: hypothetical protein AAGF89_12780 [Bacteroidota bacterium]
MRELEDLLRRESHRERPESPPPGSFSELRARLESTGRKYHWLRWVLPISLLALAILGYTQVDFTAKMASPVEAAAPENERNSAQRKKSKQETPAEVKSAVTPTTAAVNDPSLTKFEKRLAASQGQAISPQLADQTPREKVATKVDLLPAEEKRIKTNFVITPRESPAVVFDQGPTVGQSVPKKPIPKKEKLILPTIPRIIHSPRKIQGTTAQTAVQKITNTLTPAVLPSSFSAVSLSSKLRGNSARGGWDLSLSHYAFRRDFTGFAPRYTDNENLTSGASPQIFIIDGEARSLYPLDFLSRPSTNRVNVGQLRLNRQAGSGVRFGIGITLYRDRLNTEETVRNIGNTFPNSYFLVSKRTNTYLVGHAQLGYTFMRRRRLQPWLALGIQAPMVSRDKGSTYLLHNGNLHFVSERLATANVFKGNLQLFPSLEGGIQYRFTEKLSGGLNIGMLPREDFYIKPTLGMEVRYYW